MSTEGSGAGPTRDAPRQPRRENTAATRPRMASTAGKLYADFIEADLDAERKRRTYLGERGAGVVATASVLATVVFAVSVLFARSQGDSPDRVTGTAVLVGIALFVVAALCGIVAALPPKHEVAHSDIYYDMIRNRWDDAADVALRNVAYRNEIALKSLRSSNRRRAAWLLPAFSAQIAAAVALLVAVGNALLGG